MALLLILLLVMLWLLLSILLLLLRTCSSKLEQELEQHRKEDLELRLSGGSPESQVALKVLPPCDFLCYSHFVSFFFRTRLVLQFEPQESSESISREEKLLEEMLRLKLTVSSFPFSIINKLFNNLFQKSNLLK